MRLQDHFERLPQGHVLELAAECALYVGVRHNTQSRISNEHQEQICNWGRIRQRDADRTRVVEVAALLPLIELCHRERSERWCLRRLLRR
jgi:hypothetical protein